MSSKDNNLKSFHDRHQVPHYPLYYDRHTQQHQDPGDREWTAAQSAAREYERGFLREGWQRRWDHSGPVRYNRDVSAKRSDSSYRELEAWAARYSHSLPRRRRIEAELRGASQGLLESSRPPERDSRSGTDPRPAALQQVRQSASIRESGLGCARGGRQQAPTNYPPQTPAADTSHMLDRKEKADYQQRMFSQPPGYIAPPPYESPHKGSPVLHHCDTSWEQKVSEREMLEERAERILGIHLHDRIAKQQPEDAASLLDWEVEPATIKDNDIEDAVEQMQEDTINEEQLQSQLEEGGDVDPELDLKEEPQYPMVLWDAVNRIRKHTAPDSENEEEEVSELWDPESVGEDMRCLGVVAGMDSEKIVFDGAGQRAVSTEESVEDDEFAQIQEDSCDEEPGGHTEEDTLSCSSTSSHGSGDTIIVADEDEVEETQPGQKSMAGNDEEFQTEGERCCDAGVKDETAAKGEGDSDGDESVTHVSSQREDCQVEATNKTRAAKMAETEREENEQVVFMPSAVSDEILIESESTG
ncbi:hypothetical protein EYF80_045321 [Liparis tanakae]|uniref:Uncharacterized protein n=1 Tax=Liparis tanakae TaxID=230148 RepID=A0A4Z2FTF2_9TELE|nr:hypothetical protein EYF80_045321 [Liparis tanakae]